MRTVVIGSKELSCILLDTLLEQGHEVLGVFSRDDEPGMGIWHEDLGHRSLATLAQSHGIPVHFGMKVNSEESLELLSSLQLDVIFSCFWSELFKAEVLGIPRQGIFNFHTAYLPKNRGSRPIPWSIIKGEPYCGITLHKMETGVDNGPIADQEKVAIESEDNAYTLYIKLMFAGKRMFERALPNFDNGLLKLEEQSATDATYQLRGEPFGGQLQWDWLPEQKERFVRAMDFPPFRGHRQPPQALYAPGVRLCVITPKGDVLSSDDTPLSVLNIPDIYRFKTTLTGGDAIQRKELRNSIGDRTEQGILLYPQVDLEEHFPIMEALLRKNVLAVSSKEFRYVSSLNLMDTQPYRYHNGLLEVPQIVVESAKEAAEIVAQADLESRTINIAVYVTLRMEAEIADETFRILSQENLTSDLRKVGFREVCNEFDTAYEDFST
ncbi:MAG: methionyl-tRNA formyltransferase [Flavobacteriales bacterium]|nr:methionyl-tRNA formyltransferase [Flavobacteriales bacterium]